MAKHNCAICGAEVGLLSSHQLADKTYICRKVCAKKCLKVFELVPATLSDVEEHIKQVEFGTKVWNQIFVPLKKTKEKGEKLKGLCQYDNMVVSPSTGLVAVTQDDYKFFIFGKSTRACVYRIADLYSYEYETEITKDSEGKDVTKHFCRFIFNNVSGLYNFRMPLSSEGQYREIDKYFDNMFGIQKTLGNSFNNAKRQMDAIKSTIGAVKAAMSESEDVAEKTQKAFDDMNAYKFGDRTKWAEKADAALASVK